MIKMRYEGRCLTPVHIGTGEIIDPLDYVIKNGDLVRYSLQSVLDDLPDAERGRLLGLLDRGDLRETHNFVRNHVDPDKHAVAKIPASPEVQRAFENNIGRMSRQLKVHPMIRNLHRGCAYIPGSSIKGAIRTAVVSELINQEPQRSAFEHEQNDQRRCAIRLQELALDYAFRNLEKDPFRTIKISDAELEPNATRIDEVFNVKPDRQQDMPVDMWERTWSLADGRDVRFVIDIRFDGHLFDHPAASKHLGRRLVWDDVVDMCNRFHWENLKYEVDRFYRGGLIKTVLYRPFFVPKADGNVFAKRPRSPNLLLRLGRFGHFESKSVDHFRRGFDLRRRCDIRQGATRNLVRISVSRQDGGRAQLGIPFGWVLLTPMKTP